MRVPCVPHHAAPTSLPAAATCAAGRRFRQNCFRWLLLRPLAAMGHIQVTVKVAKPNINSKMGVTVTKTGPSAVFVSDLKPGFCGQQAGLMFNDIILQVNGENVETPVQCTDLLKVAKPTSTRLEDGHVTAARFVFWGV